MLLPIAPTDSLFLLGESREHPMHVGGLAIFTPPDGATAADMRAMLDTASADGQITPLFRKRARRSLTTLGQWGWDTLADDALDLEHHIRRDSLPTPGGMTELTALVSRLHSTLLDRSRPLWEMHLIEGLTDGRYALYTKIHHALADGASTMRLLRAGMSEDPHRRNMPAPWQVPHPPTPPPSAEQTPPITDASPTASALSTVRGIARTTVAEVTGLIPATVSTLGGAVRGTGGAIALTAPRTLFNVPIGAARHADARSFPLERIRLLAKHADATINDIILTLCSGTLRTYLHERNALPAAPMIAMVPVSLRATDTTTSHSPGGNRVGVLMCNLGTHLPAPADRLEAVRTSMREGKSALRAMSPTQVLAMSALAVAPLGAEMFLGRRGPQRPPFNIVISNIAGPPHPLYWNGFRLDTLHPLSIPTTGQALNITATSNDDHLVLGLTSCRRTVPDLNPLLDHLDTALDHLETALGL
ncbi:wax ester/triacylglycerol synthase family O-acyltransferase [Rhodococcus erythropolis]|uniref:WS/DGAT/MGAT family O-acyltransferase n=1 Tax=Rhodococcus erythropolis TaxID=1833 RepID=UPI0029497D13|nr:wax ester/triacylglycerol synthase family O-acyltransferase [Rhodococcus erythropolis]MDV6278187.1 wax ester/triacylglycerol synthase family O-acyltransferase [Rhodococcus erythropolis]